MAEKRKRGVKKQLPPLCAAVKKLREVYGDTLERFSQRVGISMNSASRFELGKAIPSDPAVLTKLWTQAHVRGIPEAELFLAAAEEANTKRTWEQFYAPDRIETRYVEVPKSLTHWRYVAALRLAMAQFPETLSALEDALAPALEIVDTVLNTVNDPFRANYRDMDRQLTQLAEQRELAELQKRKRDK
jgi:transcriptional regulator with XRE-family HTH domain